MIKEPLTNEYRVFSGPNTGKYGPEKTPYLDTFYAVNLYPISRQYSLLYLIKHQRTRVIEKNIGLKWVNMLGNRLASLWLALMSLLEICSLYHNITFLRPINHKRWKIFSPINFRAQIVFWLFFYDFTVVYYHTTSFNKAWTQFQILLAACPRFAMVRISDNGPGLK